MIFWNEYIDVCGPDYLGCDNDCHTCNDVRKNLDGNPKCPTGIDVLTKGITHIFRFKLVSEIKLVFRGKIMTFWTISAWLRKSLRMERIKLISASFLISARMNEFLSVLRIM